MGKLFFIIGLLLANLGFAQTQGDFLLPPKILSSKDALAYEQIFDLQRIEKNAEADILIKTLDDDILMGYVQFQRYMHAGKYRASFKELRAWLDKYDTQIGAARVYRLARKRNYNRSKHRKPTKEVFIPSSLAGDSNDEKKASSYSKKERNILKRVRILVHDGYVTRARDYLRGFQKSITAHAYSEALGHIARGYYRYGKYGESILAGQKAQLFSKGDVVSSIASWWGGLSAWRLEDYKVSSELFSHVVLSESQDEWLRSAGAFWSARSYDKLGRGAKADEMRREALQAPHSFYGLLSAELLGVEDAITWQSLTASPLNPAVLLEISSVREAYALDQAGQGDIAESVLKPIIKRLSFAGNVALLQWTRPLQMAFSSYSISKVLHKSSGVLWLESSYPTASWLFAAIAEGQLVDRAVIMGMARQESSFERRAQSSAKAQGVMQLLPSTASIVNGKRIPKSRRHLLFKPELNISLGQKYISRLINYKNVNNNLLYAVVSYNAGPGNLRKWQKKLKLDNDPLLFIESLPWLETRIYAERVLANIWMYRLLLGQESPTLKAFAKNESPFYIQQDR